MTVVAWKTHKGWAVAVLALVISWHGWWVTRGWDIQGMSGHEFRQTQTAVTIRAMKEDGFRLDYATPILGKPWSIPFEFPAYQGMAAALSNSTGLGIIESGRWVSLTMFYLAVPAFVLLLGLAGFSPMAAVLGIVPLLFAPVYLLYSRSVMIESTALCASGWFLYLLMRYRLSRKPGLLAATLVVGALAAVTKATTWAVFCLPWAACFFADAWTARKRGWRGILSLVDEAVLIGVPLLVVGCGWVWLTDRIKELNPIGGFLTSGNLRAFNFGTFEQHFDAEIWKALWRHWGDAVMPWWGLALGAVGVALAPKGRRMIWALGMGVFLMGQFLFINLYAIHNYYFYANAWAACIAVGSVAGMMWDSGRRWQLGAGPAVLLLFVVCGGQHFAYGRDFYKTQITPREGSFGLPDAINRLTGPDDVIVMHSPDWNSILPYWSERRMLIIPDSQMFLREDAVRESIALLKDESVPLVIFRGETRTQSEWILKRIRDLDLAFHPLFTWQDDAVVYARREDYARMHRILLENEFAGVVANPLNQLPPLHDAVRIEGTPEWEGIPNMDPRPHSGFFPYGIQFREIDGEKALFGDPPTELYFDIPRGATRVEFGFQAAPEAYLQRDFDGVYVVLELREEGQPPVSLREVLLTRDGPRGLHRAVAALPPSAQGTLVLRTFAGPTNNSAYDWIVVNFVRIR